MSRSTSQLNKLMWPHLEVLDLTNNATNELSEFKFLFSAKVLNLQVIKIVGVRDNFDSKITLDSLDELLPAQLDT